MLVSKALLFAEYFFQIKNLNADLLMMIPKNLNKQQVFIHGESFEWSGGSVFDGTALAAYGDILVITINYRLGALGKLFFF